MCFYKYLAVMFSVGLSPNVNNPVLASQVALWFHQFLVINAFCIEGSNKRSDCGTLLYVLEFIDRTFRASISSFSALHKLINAYSFFL